MPVFLRTHYQQYKRDTDQLSTWLGKTAVSPGFPVASLTMSEVIEGHATETRTASQVKNAKNKARDKAKNQRRKEAGGQQAAQAIPDEGVSITGNYKLKFSQYIELARFVVENAVDIPVEVTRILKRCITLRGKALARFSITEDPANDQHRHFV